MDMELEEQVRHLAYAIWELEGRPDGRAHEHWDRALKEIAAPAVSRLEATPLKKSDRRPAAKAQVPKPKRKVARPASVVFN